MAGERDADRRRRSAPARRWCRRPPSARARRRARARATTSTLSAGSSSPRASVDPDVHRDGGGVRHRVAREQHAPPHAELRAARRTSAGSPGRSSSANSITPANFPSIADVRAQPLASGTSASGEPRGAVTHSSTKRARRRTRCRPPTIAGHAAPGRLAHVRRRRELEAALLRRVHDRARQQVPRPPLHRGRQPRARRLREPRRRHRRRSPSACPTVSVPVLSNTTAVTLAELLERAAVLHDDQPARGAVHPADDRDRRGEDQRARRRDDEHGEHALDVAARDVRHRAGERA